MSTLTPAQILSLTGDEPPLTAEDRRTVVDYVLGGCWYGEWLLAGGWKTERIRQSSLGVFGWITDHLSVSSLADGRGFLVRVTEHPEGRDHAERPRPAPAAVRAGHITWRDAAAILRAIQADDGALFTLEAS